MAAGDAEAVMIVPMTLDDLTWVLEIERASFHDPWPAMAFVETMTAPCLSWTAQVDGEPAGYLVTQWVLDEVHILNVAVAPGMRRRSVGSALLNFLFELAPKRGGHELFLEVRVSNDAAISLYERFGFRKLTLRKKYYGDGEHAWVMHRRLEPEAHADTAPANESNVSR